MQGLRSGYHGVTVLKGLDFSVGDEIFAVLGANGAGKTTLLATLARLIPPMGGAIRFQGEDVSAMAPYETAGRGIGYVPQEKGVFTNLTVLENLSVGGMIGQRPRDERIAEILELFPALKDLQRQPAGTLSGGESRMVACGRALMQEPRILLLDEPTAGLSPLYVDHFFEKITEIHQTRGRRHRPRRAERHEGAPGGRPGDGPEPRRGVRGHGCRRADDPAVEGGLPDLIVRQSNPGRPGPLSRARHPEQEEDR